MYIYIYIQKERQKERETERERDRCVPKIGCWEGIQQILAWQELALEKGPLFKVTEGRGLHHFKKSADPIGVKRLLECI